MIDFIECLWCLPVRLWNRLQHAIHGNGSHDEEDELALNLESTNP